MRSRTGLPIVAVVLLLGMVGSAAAQDTTRATPTSLARVLAEAARDFRTGAPVYLVAARRFPEYVVGGFPTRARADRVAADSGAGYGVFGPYLTPRDVVSPDSTAIDSVVVFLREPGGTQRVKLGPGVDALFLNQAAVDKFLVPYYSSLYGPMAATLMRQQAMARPPACHIGGTIWCHSSDGFPSVLPLRDPIPDELHPER